MATEKSGTPQPGSDNGKQTAEEPGASIPEPETININTATAEELQYLPSIGPVLADKIIAERPYRTIDELKKINGIGDGIVRQIKEQGKATVK